MTTVDELIAHTIDEFEGEGFTNHPADRGGPTKFGITQATLSSFRGRPCSAEDVQALERDEAERCYRKIFFEDTGVAKWPAPLQALGFDMFVNHSPKGVGGIVQRVLIECGWTIAQDGIIGSITRAALEQAHEAMGVLLQDALCDERALYYKSLVAKHASQKVFLDGWLRRAAYFRSEEPDWLPERFRKEPPKPVPVPLPRPSAPIVIAPPPERELRTWERLAAALVPLLTALATALGIATADQSTPPAHLPAALQLEDAP